MCVCVCVRLTVRTPGLLDAYTDPQRIYVVVMTLKSTDALDTDTRISMSTDALDTDTRDFHVHVYTYSL